VIEEQNAMNNDILIQQPQAAQQHAEELVLLFHGVGSNARDLQALGEALAARMPQAWVISVCAPERLGNSNGWQWFSVQGITEDNRPARVAAAMPAFIEAISRWQAHAGVDQGRTTLVGFSQGSIMSLESTQQALPPAGRVAAIAGRFAQPPHVNPEGVLIHLLHGEQDTIVPTAQSIKAAAVLQDLGADVSLDLFPGLGHQIDGRVLQSLLDRLGSKLMS
jgi:phospholipase/carboxylesterase